LAGGVAHDFNNLLIVINGYSDFVLKKLTADDPLYLPAQEINKAGERAASLTKQLLAFSRKQIIEPQPLDLNMIVNDTERMFQRLIGEDIELAISLDPLLGQIMADPAQIHKSS
jgi:two-component system, cell cycle sensor histidine kinase and response regulator CckA